MEEDIAQDLINETTNNINTKKGEIRESDKEVAILKAKLEVEKRTLEMKDLKDDLKEDFEYSKQALEGMLIQEQQRNFELKKDLEILEFRHSVIRTQF
jgi:hypothetical protein